MLCELVESELRSYKVVKGVSFTNLRIFIRLDTLGFMKFDMESLAEFLIRMNT